MIQDFFDKFVVYIMIFVFLEAYTQKLNKNVDKQP